jgi:hypothetical protein
MFARVKPLVFLDSLTVELSSPQSNGIRAVLKDEKGLVCRSLETNTHYPSLFWGGLNDLPYGVYTVELHNGEEEMQVRIIKRV